MVTSDSFISQEGFSSHLVDTKYTPDTKLSDSWALWVMCQQGKLGKEHWQANQTKAHEIFTVGDFWRLYNHIHAASRLSHADYSLFRLGVAPAWEDPSCKNGGRWIAKCNAIVDESWLNVQLALIGEAYRNIASSICGAVYSARRGGVKIALWLTNCDDAVVQEAGRIFKSCLPSEQAHHIVFESFTSTISTDQVVKH